MDNIAAEQGIILEIVKESPLGIVILALLDKAKRYGNQKGNYSVEYFAEELIANGARSFDNYLDADKKRRNDALYNAAVARVAPPNPQDMDSMAKYANTMLRLQQKYGIGGTQVEV